MYILYLASFIGGLLLAARIMIVGVERPREDHPTGERTFRLSPAVVSSLALVFGFAGYLMARRQVGTTLSQFLIAAALAGVAAIVTARLVRDWWKITPEHDVDDERYVLQGHVARVTRPIQADVEGEVTYIVGRAEHVMRARGIDDRQLVAGDDVVIERIEDEVAYVELWDEVEKRL